MQDRNAQQLEVLGLRPLSARSVVASVLLGTHPPELPAAALVRLCDRFGIAEGTTRVALSRMVAAGELAPVDGGYRLAGEALLSRQRAQDEARHPPALSWDGNWRMAVVVSGSRTAAERADLRRAFLQARFAQWREGVWLRPSNLAPPADPALAGPPCQWLTARPEGDPAALAARLWDLHGWRERARSLMAVTDRAPGDLLGADRSRAAAVFAAAAALLRHLRIDPLLPVELLPSRWPADQLRERYSTHLVSIQDLIRHLAREDALDDRRRV
jgi:phenylacetic acid degradation operon negative regulatory protein